MKAEWTKIILTLLILTSIKCTKTRNCSVQNCRVCSKTEPGLLCQKCEEKYMRKSFLTPDGNSIYHICENQEDVFWIRVGVISGISLLVGFFVWVFFVKCFLKSEKNLLLGNQRERFHYKRLIRRRKQEEKEVVKKSQVFYRMKSKEPVLIFEEYYKLKRKMGREMRHRHTFGPSSAKFSSLKKMLADAEKEVKSVKEKPRLPLGTESSDNRQENGEIHKINNVNIPKIPKEKPPKHGQTSIETSIIPRMGDLAPKKIYSRPNSQKKLSPGDENNPSICNSCDKISLPIFGNIMMESMSDFSKKKNSTSKAKNEKSKAPKSIKSDNEDEKPNPLLMFSQNCPTSTLMKSTIHSAIGRKKRESSKNEAKIESRVFKKKRRNIFSNEKNKSNVKEKSFTEKFYTPLKLSENVKHGNQFSGLRRGKPKILSVKRGEPRLVKTTVKYPEDSVGSIRKVGRSGTRFFKTSGKINLVKKSKEIFRGKSEEQKENVVRIIGDMRPVAPHSNSNQLKNFNPKKVDNNFMLVRSKTTFGVISPKNNNDRKKANPSFEISPTRTLEKSVKNDSLVTSKLKKSVKFSNLMFSENYLNSNPYYTQLQSTDRFKSPKLKKTEKSLYCQNHPSSTYEDHDNTYQTSIDSQLNCLGLSDRFDYNKRTREI